MASTHFTATRCCPTRYFQGLNITGGYTDEDLEAAKEYASKAEYTVVVIGEAT